MDFGYARSYAISDFKQNHETHIVPLPEIPKDFHRETRPLATNVEKMPLDMGLQPISEVMPNRLIATGYYGMPQE